LPFANPNYHQDNCPFGVDKPEPTISTAAEMGLDSKWRLHTAPVKSQLNVTFNDNPDIISAPATTTTTEVPEKVSLTT